MKVVKSMKMDSLNRVKSALQEIIQELERPQTQLLQRDPTIQALIDNLVRRVEAQRKPENWPVEEYTDDFKKYHPADHQQWVWLFMQAAFKSRELADTLCILRGMGCELVPDQTYGYVIRPIIGGKGWQSIEQYNLTKEPLKDHTNELLPLLKQLGGKIP